MYHIYLFPQLVFVYVYMYTYQESAHNIDPGTCRRSLQRSRILAPGEI